MNYKLLHLAHLTPVIKGNLYSIARIFIFTILYFSLSAPVYSAGNFRLAVVNERPDKPDYAINQYGQLHAYLSEKLKQQGIEVAPLLIVRNISELVNLVEHGEVDAFFEGVVPTIDIQQKTRMVSSSLIAWCRGQRQYHSVFFVRKDSPITNLQALDHKVIVFESLRSTSAFLVPKTALQAQGMFPVKTTSSDHEKGDVHYIFAGSELNQAYWVQRGRADAGAFNNGDWERVPEVVKQDLRIIYRTKPILRWLFSYVEGLDEKTQSAVASVLLSAHEDEAGQRAMFAAEQITKFEAMTDEDKKNMAFWSDMYSNLQ